MKFYSLIVCIFLLSVDAQRRSVKSELLSDNEPASRSARRGRARFTVTSDPPDVEEPKASQPANRRLTARRRPESHAVPRKAYEVDEVVDDIPVESFRRFKTKVVTDNKFEALNAPSSNTLFQPATTENLEEIIKSDITDTTSPSVEPSPTASSFETSAPELPSEDSKIDNEISKTVPETTTPLPTRNSPRNNARSRSNSIPKVPTIASRLRARARTSERQEEENAPAPILSTRGSRRRLEPSASGETRTRALSSSAESLPTRSRFEARTRAPATVSSETAEGPKRSRFEARTRAPVATSTETAEVPARARFEARTRAPVMTSAESIELPTRSRFTPRTRADKTEQPRRVRVETRTRGPSVIASAESSELPSRSRSGRRIGTASRRSEEAETPERISIDLTHSRRTSARQTVEATSVRSRSRSRAQETPPVIDEQKLEVLPLFERETKTVKPVVRKVVSRRRNLNSAEEVEMSATEDEVKVMSKAPKESVVVETRTEATIKRRKVTAKPVSRTTRATVVSTKATVRSTKPTIKSIKATIKSTKPMVKPTKAAQVENRKPVIKESVISEVTEVTSKRTITRKERVKVVSIKPFSRGSRKPEVNSTSVKKNKSGLTSSEEEIEDTDNYPEHFKAILQAKKQKIESRPPQQRLTTASPAVTKSTEKVVISSPSTTTHVISSEANRQLEDSENELLDPPKVKPTRRRFTSSTTEKGTRTTRKNKFNRSTAAPAVATSEHRFHAKFNTDTEATNSNPVKSRSFSPKPPRGLYSSRKTKESSTKNKSTTQIPVPKKSVRYSSRYRNDASTRGAIRTSTNAPAYLPTIPTITPPTTSVKSSLSYQDKDLGVEVISFDDPVNTVPSANLVSGEYLASSTENGIISPLVSASQTKITEKPVSIIERIINSITAISTTEAPDASKLTTPPPANIPTKQSAILKLATKKSTRLDKVQTTQNIPTVTVTSEKPTTIIERILSSLSAIQADNTTATKYSKSKQVGTNFNTISSPSTTPLTRVTKSTLYAPLGTSVNPLFALDDISDEQLLQKRTIDKLLVLLNTLTSPHPPQPTPLVVVTPKTTSYVVGSSATATTVPPTTTATSSTTTEPTTTTTETTSPLFTSPAPSVAVSSRSFPAVRYTTTPTTTTTTLTTQVPITTTPAVTTTTQTPILTSTEVVTTSQVSTTTPTLTTTATATSSATTGTVGTTDTSNEIEPLPLSLESESGVTSLSSVTETPSSTDFSSMSTDSTPSTDSSTVSSTEFAVDTETNFAFPSTVPALINFNVSPDSVSVFNANDISNAITRDFPSTTVTISGRSNVVTTETTASTQTTTSSPNSDNTTTQNSVTVQTSTSDATTENPTGTTAQSSVQNSTSDAMTENSTGTTTSSPDATSTTDAGSTMSPATTVTTELSNMTTTDSSASSNTTQDISSNIIDTTDLPEKSNQTSTVDRTNTTSRASGRSGRLLGFDPNPVQNFIESSTPRPKDYFIFAVLNNNTVLRKRPSRFPNKDTPYLIVGLLPNNTIIRRFPNGTLVPMEPVIRVSGFDTRDNPPPLPEITSNQVTPDQGSRPDNKNLQTVDLNTVPPFEANPLSLSSVNNATSTTGNVASSTASSIQANPLSLSSNSSTTTETSTSTSTSSNSSTAAPATTTTSGTTTSSTAAPTATLPTLTEILNGRTVQAFNSIINISNLSKVQTLEVDPKSNTMTTTLSTPTLSNRILDDPVSSTMSLTTTTTQQPTTTMLLTTTTPPKTTTTMPPTTTTTVPTTTEPPSTPPTFISTRGTTVLPLSQPVTTTFRTTTGFPSTTFLPQFLTTFFSTLRPRQESTETPLTIVTPIPNRVPTTTPRVEISTGGDLATAASTRRTVRTTTEPTTTILSTLPVSTTRMSRRRTTTMTTTTSQPTTTILTTTLASSTIGRNARRSTERPTTTTDATKKLRQLTDQQKKDLQTLAKLEMEQASLLKQLAFLTNLNFANVQPTTDKNDLANRIIAMAVEQEKERLTTTLPPTTTPENNRKAKKLSTSSEQSIEELVKQLNIVTPTTFTTDYGRSNDAIIAALLKEQGIGPETPRALGDVYNPTTTAATTTTRKPRTTTRRPGGPLMQSLNWLLNVLAPPTTKRPRPKPKSKKPKTKPVETQEEILTHQPTHITPVVTAAPRENLVTSLSQTDIEKLIQQLEGVQKDPQNAKSLDFSSIKSLQNLLAAEEGVKVTSIGTTGTTTRETTPVPVTTTARRKGKSRVIKSTTVATSSVSNSIDEEEFSTTTTRAKAALPPVRLRPVPGVEDDGTLVRGQLINAAVNVTRAISSFLGTALQGAATSFQSILGSGSRVVGSLMQVSSNTSSRPG